MALSPHSITPRWLENEVAKDLGRGGPRGRESGKPRAICAVEWSNARKEIGRKLATREPRSRQPSSDTRPFAGAGLGGVAAPDGAVRLATVRAAAGSGEEGEAKAAGRPGECGAEQSGGCRGEGRGGRDGQSECQTGMGKVGRRLFGLGVSGKAVVAVADARAAPATSGRRESRRKETSTTGGAARRGGRGRACGQNTEGTDKAAPRVTA